MEKAKDKGISQILTKTPPTTKIIITIQTHTTKVTYNDNEIQQADKKTNKTIYIYIFKDSYKRQRYIHRYKHL